MSPCPSDDTFVRLLDGQLSEERAARLRSHSGICPGCAGRLQSTQTLLQRIAAPVSVHPGSKARLLERVSRTGQAPRERERPGLRWITLGLAAAASLVIAVAVRPIRDPDSGFTARGATPSTSVARDVGVRFYTGGSSLQPLVSGRVLRSADPLITTYRNVSKTRAYLDVVAIDAAGKVHWVQPEAGATEPVALNPGDHDAPLPETVVLDSPAPGLLRLLVVVASTPIPPSALGEHPTAASLSARFPQASVDEVTVTVVP